MNESERLADQLDSMYKGDPWHGPAVTGVLEGVPAELARRKPIASAHSIWEIVAHVIVWKDVVRRRILGEIVNPTPEEDWPPVTASDDTAWNAAVADLDRAHRELVSAVRSFDPDSLHVILPGRKTDAAFQINGAIHHDIYHAGQIAVLRK